MFHEFYASSHISITRLDYSIQFLRKINFSSFRGLIPLILNLFDSIYDRDPPESQFDRSHQTTRRSQQTVTSIRELNQIFANQHRMSSTRSSLKSINRTIPSINAGIN